MKKRTLSRQSGAAGRSTSERAASPISEMVNAAWIARRQIAISKDESSNTIVKGSNAAKSAGLSSYL